jgi:hypothetical protein
MGQDQSAGSLAYTVRRAAKRPELKGQWDSPAWRQAEELAIEHFHAESSDHRPQTRLKLLYDQAGLYAIFDVRDRFVRSVQTAYQGPVYTDSCVELFLEPKLDQGYFNFEFNCGGTLLLHHSKVEEVDGKPKKSFTPVDSAHIQGVRVYHSLPKVVEPELLTETNWQLECFIPFEVFSPYLGALGDVKGQTWRANFFKCGDATSHPHWASWAPIGAELNFHQPCYFAPLIFAQ